jgi:hypothetical protein
MGCAVCSDAPRLRGLRVLGSQRREARRRLARPVSRSKASIPGRSGPAGWPTARGCARRQAWWCSEFGSAIGWTTRSHRGRQGWRVRILRIGRTRRGYQSDYARTCLTIEFCIIRIWQQRSIRWPRPTGIPARPFEQLLQCRAAKRQWL